MSRNGYAASNPLIDSFSEHTSIKYIYAFIINKKTNTLMFFSGNNRKFLRFEHLKERCSEDEALETSGIILAKVIRQKRQKCDK